MRITLTRSLAGHTNGATIERSTKVAQLLIAHGAANEAEQDKPVTSDDATTSEPKPKRTRRSESRNSRSGEAHAAKASDVSAGQEGGEGPPPLPTPTAG